LRRWILVAIPAAVVALPILAFVILSLFSRRPSNLGVANGRLAPCPASPNCVATQSGAGEQRMAPLPFHGTPAEAMARLKQTLQGMPRTRIVTADESYLHAEFVSALFRFVDDVEFLIDPEARVIHFRSASRVGYSDLGANRRRMVAIQRAFCQE
jgi:uncharacterized protein (DUF1499 family)